MKALLKWLRWRVILLFAALTPPCRQIVRLASSRYEQPLGLWTRLSLRVHLGICRACKRYLRQLDVLHETARQSGGKQPDLGHGTRLADDAKVRLKSRLRCERVG